MIYSKAQLRKLIVSILIGLYFNSLRRRNRLTRSAILELKTAPWYKIISSADDNSFLEITGFSKKAFNSLLADILPRDGESKQRFGRPSHLDLRGKLALYLIFCNSRMKLTQLCLLFGHFYIINS